MGSTIELFFGQPIAKKLKIYLDYAATTPMAPQAVDELARSLTLSGNFANPASLQHGFSERVAHGGHNISVVTEIVRAVL